MSGDHNDFNAGYFGTGFRPTTQWALGDQMRRIDEGKRQNNVWVAPPSVSTPIYGKYRYTPGAGTRTEAHPLSQKEKIIFGYGSLFTLTALAYGAYVMWGMAPLFTEALRNLFKPHLQYASSNIVTVVIFGLALIGIVSGRVIGALLATVPHALLIVVIALCGYETIGLGSSSSFYGAERDELWLMLAAGMIGSVFPFLILRIGIKRYREDEKVGGYLFAKFVTLLVVVACAVLLTAGGNIYREYGPEWIAENDGILSARLFQTERMAALEPYYCLSRPYRILNTGFEIPAGTKLKIDRRASAEEGRTVLTWFIPRGQRSALQRYAVQSIMIDPYRIRVTRQDGAAIKLDEHYANTGSETCPRGQ